MAKVEASPLEAHLGYWMRFVSNHVSHGFKLKVESRGVTIAEWVVMRALFNPGEVNPSQLAERIGVTRGTVSKLVNRLVAKDLVRCVAEKGDRRFQRVGLTPAGRRLVPVLATLADQNDSEFFGHLDKRQQADLAVLLKDIVRRNEIKQLPMD